MLCTICATTNGTHALFCQGCGSSLEPLRRLVEGLEIARQEIGSVPTSKPEEPTRPGKLFPRRNGLDVGTAIPLLDSPVVVGRFSPSSGPVDVDLALIGEASHVSRRHASLFFAGGVWRVQDLESANGTFLRRSNDEGPPIRLTDITPLADGDEIAFGHSVFVFRED